MKFPSFRARTVQEEFAGVLVKDGKETASTLVEQYWDGRTLPDVPFIKKYEYYKTSAKIQNAVEGFVLDILNRDWYYDSKNPNQNKPLITMMENWEEEFNASEIFETHIRNWVVLGNHINSVIDWKPVQMKTIVAKIRNEYGFTDHWIQHVNQGEVKLYPYNEQSGDLELYESFYINLGREPWGVAMFESLMTQYTDVDKKRSLPLIEVWRQMMQDIGHIHHKYASPRLIYIFPNTSKEIVEKKISALIESMKPGDRLALNTQDGKLIAETVDAKARFAESVDKLGTEIEIGLQSSKNRLISQPSAMADARVAGQQDDDRTLGLMEKLRRVMNQVYIPKITGAEPGLVEFHWGSRDSFDLTFPPGLALALETGVVLPDQAEQILVDRGWKIPKTTMKRPELPSTPITNIPRAPTPTRLESIDPLRKEALESICRVLNKMEKVQDLNEAQKLLKEKTESELSKSP